MCRMCPPGLLGNFLIFYFIYNCFKGSTPNIPTVLLGLIDVVWSGEYLPSKWSREVDMNREEPIVL